MKKLFNSGFPGSQTGDGQQIPVYKDGISQEEVQKRQIKAQILGSLKKKKFKIKIKNKKQKIIKNNKIIKNKK